MTPDAFTIQEHFIEVGDGHVLYVHDWGNKNANTPILFLHGGPGSHTKDRHKSMFEPKVQRVIFFDQRGCGKSTPYGSIKHNNTQKMIEDISSIADYLKINKFIISGGSWGSCLALAYALEYQNRIQALVLHGVFTGSKKETDWLDKGEYRTFYPDVWENFIAAVPKENQYNPTKYLYDKIMGPDEQAAKEAGYAYENMETGVISLDDRFEPVNFEEYDPSGIRIEMHYMQNLCFLPDRYILDNANKLKMPVWLVQGRYDMVCPPETAYELSKGILNSKLIWTTSGHYTERESWNLIKTILSQLTEKS